MAEALAALAVLALPIGLVVLLLWRIHQYRRVQAAVGRSATLGGFWSFLNSDRPDRIVPQPEQPSAEPHSAAQGIGNRPDRETENDTAVREKPTESAPSVRPHRVLFICYRRDDTADAAGRLHDNLANAYGTSRVFMDIDSVPLGTDFVEHVTGEIANCSAVIVMIGRQWLTASDKQGRRRISLAEDLVRIEIAAALQRRIPVIPVLVHDADMPSAEDLPDDIRSLSRRNGIDLSGPAWRGGIERLIRELDLVMKPSTGS